MRPVHRGWTADRHAHTVQRKWMIAAQPFQRAVRRATSAHIILGMNLEEAALRACAEDSCKMLMLEARPRDPAGVQGKAEGNGSGRSGPVRCVHVAPPLF